MKVLILHDGTSPDDVQRLREWLKKAGCEVDVFEASSKAEALKSLAAMLAKYDVIVLLLGSDLPELAIQTALNVVKATGKKAVGVYSANNPKPKLTPEFEKYGSSLMAMDREKIVGAICSNADEWTDDKGKPRAASKTKRHKCC